ncbi:F-box domain, cyclin-like protein [Tanacetum coccineum]
MVATIVVADGAGESYRMMSQSYGFLDSVVMLILFNLRPVENNNGFLGFMLLAAAVSSKNHGLPRFLKCGHLKELHRAIKLCEHALLNKKPTLVHLGLKQEFFFRSLFRLYPTESTTICSLSLLRLIDAIGVSRHGMDGVLFINADVFEDESGTCAAFIANLDDKTEKTVQFQNVSYTLPAWSVSILPDCKNVVFNTAKVGSQTSTIEMVPEQLQPSVVSAHKDLKAITSGARNGTVSPFKLKSPVSLKAGKNEIAILSITVGLSDRSMNGLEQVLSFAKQRKWLLIAKKLDVNEDRLSGLPDELIHQILFGFDTKFEFRTCVMSSRCKFIWDLIPRLDFSTQQFKTLPKFANSVTHVLTHRNRQVEVSSVKLRFHGVASLVFVKKIANYAFSHNVQELTIISLPRNRPRNHHEYPPCLFSSQTLKHLSLEMLGDDADESVDLFSNCLNLENLVIESSSIRAKNLTVIKSSINNIKPPLRLSYLRYSGYFYPKWFENCFHSLNEVSVSLSHTQQGHAARKTINMLQELRSARCLILNKDIVECISSFLDLLSHLPSPVSNLISLNITSNMRNEHKVKLSAEARNFLSRETLQYPRSIKAKMEVEKPDGVVTSTSNIHKGIDATLKLGLVPQTNKGKQQKVRGKKNWQTHVVETRRHTVEIDSDTEYESDDDSEYQSDKSADYLSPGEKELIELRNRIKANRE